MKRAKGDGIEIQTAEWAGSGEPMLCIHGITANCRCFDVIAHELSPKHRILAVDLRGRGLSDKPDTGYSIDRHCRDIEAVMDDLGLDMVNLLGHSLGGYIALALAARRPERVRRLILMDAGAQLSAEQWIKVGEAIKPSLDRLLQSFPTFEAYVANLKKMAYLNPWTEAIEDFFRYECEEVDGVVRSRIRPENIQEERENLAVTDTAQYYSGISCPVLVLRATQGMVAQDDLVVPEEALPGLKKALPQAKIVSLAGTNHYSILFQPNEERTRALLEFLSE
jgi:pimeloyl-ACP methyl ester carboxylesterase